MQLINVKSNEVISKCHDSPKRTLPAVQFSYYLLVFIQSWGGAFASLQFPSGICQFHLKSANV